MDEKEKCWCNDTGISFFVMCCKEMPVTLFLACAGFEMTDVVHKIQKEIQNTNNMLKNIQKYDILHLIIDDCRQKILKLAERPQGDMNMFKKVGLGFLFVGLAFGVMALCEITRGVGADASVKASVLWPREKRRKIYQLKQSSEGSMRNESLEI